MHKDQDGYTSVRTSVDPLHALTVLAFAQVHNKLGGTCRHIFRSGRGSISRVEKLM